MMNVVLSNTPQGISFSDTDLFIDFNAHDSVSVTFDESELSLKAEDRSRCFDKPCFPLKTLSERQDKIAVDDATAATVASSTSILTISSSKKRVRFGSLSIHSHNVELGGSGVPRTGPSITLGWEQESTIILPSVEEYEEAKPSPRRGAEMLHPKKQRVNMLLESGYTLNQIRTCDQECDAIRKQRTRTVQQVTLSDRTKSKLKKLAVWKKN
mmetsp:Transcript_20338/g.41886  ORF Transcript_20338/g.41886 Transcript_20338/m.41886 type:complete len:212 (-) Transcript_20338:92-727(-)